MNSTQSLKGPIFLWSLATLFFAYQFILRLAVGILRESIIQRFAIDTIAFGTLAGYYYLGYAGMQIPLGIMLDKFNFKAITFISILVTSIGTLAFTATNNWNLLLFSRVLIGAGSAIGFLSIAKIIKAYFAPKRHSLMFGLSFTFGLSGAVFGMTPMKILFNHFGYNNTFRALALVGVAIGLMILFININSIKPYDNEEHEIPSLRQIIKLLMHPVILLIGISSGLMVGCLDGFGDVWAMPFFKELHGMKDIDSNTATSYIYVGMCFGGPILAGLSDFFKSPGFMIFLSGIFTVLLFVVLLNCYPLSFSIISIIMFVLGIFCSYQVLVFTVTSRIIEKSLSGLAIAIVNCINMSFGYFFHKIMSIIIEYNWQGSTDANGLHIYVKQDYLNSIAVVPICCILGVCGFMWASIMIKRKNIIS